MIYKLFGVSLSGPWCFLRTDIFLSWEAKIDSDTQHSQPVTRHSHLCWRWKAFWEFLPVSISGQDDWWSICRCYCREWLWDDGGMTASGSLLGLQGVFINQVYNTHPLIELYDDMALNGKIHYIWKSKSFEIYTINSSRCLQNHFMLPSTTGGWWDIFHFLLVVTCSSNFQLISRLH